LAALLLLALASPTFADRKFTAGFEEESFYATSTGIWYVT
jgi:hypothetical protein